jgi:hypothetical protein
LKSIKGAHIFSVGTWNRSTFTEADLDAIVSAFNELMQTGRVPLKFGHNDDQPLTDGQPALGWVERVWRDGSKLFADFAEMPTVVYNAIKSKLYRFVSIELLKNAERDGKKYPYVLDAVALLGADPPAVTNLDELNALATMTRIAYTASGERLAFKRELPPFGGDESMDEETKKAIAAAVQAALAPMQTQLSELTKENGDLKKKFTDSEAERVKLQQKIDDANKAEKAGKVKMARENATTILEAAVRSKTILPAQREAFSKMFKIEDDEAVLALDISVLEQAVGTKLEDAKKVLKQKQAFSRDPAADVTDDGTAADPNATLAEKVLDHQSKHPEKDVFTCLEEVVRMSPKLAQQFTQHNFEQWEARH